MDGEDFNYFCDRGTLPPPKPEPQAIDSSIERPARKIAMFTDEELELPPGDGEGDTEGQTRT